MAKISGPGRHEWKGQSLVKLSEDIKLYVAHASKTDKTSENNEIVDKSASHLIKTRILKCVVEQIQTKSARMVDYTFENLKVYP